MSKNGRPSLDRSERWRYTEAEWERLQIRQAPRLLRPFWYFFWLLEVVPDGTGIILGTAGLLLGVGLAVGLTWGTVWVILWLAAHAAWVFWLLLGAGLALGARLVLRDAAAAERDIRERLAAKEQRERE